ncbi:MAG: ribosomal protection-like ABC-F family protein [Bacteroidaceae bacterium]
MIPYLQVCNLTRRVGDRTLFQNLSFGIGQGQKIGLIAQNGTGKSTLLNILAGTDSADEGQVIFHNGLRVGYLPQSPVYPEDMTVIEACFWHGNATTNLIREYERCMVQENHPGLDDILARMDLHKAWDYEAHSKAILSRFQIVDFQQPVSQLSGGQLKRVALANVLITEPDFLILDEPTNHLDLQMIEWLEDYLCRSKMTLLMVTHDRYFLDRVCNSILEMDDCTLYSYQGNYAYYLEKRQERMDVARAEVARANNLYRTELEWMRRMPQARGHKAKYREDAFYELEKVAKRRMDEREMRLEMKSNYIGSKIFEAAYVSKAFPAHDGVPAKVILKDFYYNFARFEKMGIVGGNGTGKTTFIRMLMGLMAPDSGRFVVGETVRFGYFSQEGMKFDEQMRVIDAVTRIAEYVDLGGGRHLSAMQFLQHFLFTPQQQQNYIYKLSGGEKRRLYLCTVLMQNPNFLVLDEPTNDLDIVSLQILEQYLQDFRGCLIVVSHDRYFMDKVVDHLLVFGGEGAVKDFPGNYTQFRQWESMQPKPVADGRKETSVPDSEITRRNRTGQPRRMTFAERKEFESLEQAIMQLEEEKRAIEEALCSGTLGVAELTEKSIRLPQLDQELDEKTLRWMELADLQQ